ncbi:CoA-transferase subunit beta [Nocardioides sp. zg-DK7169]|uniref:CoA-transferase subunit beta n=1 Tax=Nocardioides sp. zg-DK7169 TaxID=2736600 RepID=UPI001553011F|nr:CoA-transferase [Nocardioides sp. zg-DK7169]NPC98701.1 CoA-transferase [Nocardioides sp. zg-DK7169]
MSASAQGPATRAEVCAAAVADAFAEDGETLASPIGLIPMLGARLARRTVNPDLVLSDGVSLFMADDPPLGSTGQEVEGWFPHPRVFDMLTFGKRHVMMGAPQLDRHGNQNLSAIGDFDRPDRQLLGTRAAPANTVNHRTSYWIPRHSPRALVERVDVVCGVGAAAARAAGSGATRFHDLHRVVTDLAVLDFTGPDGTLRVRSVHPGVGADELRAATGFALDLPDPLPRTRLPSSEELRLIREVLDPRGLREREVPAR